MLKIKVEKYENKSSLNSLNFSNLLNLYRPQTKFGAR